MGPQFSLYESNHTSKTEQIESICSVFALVPAFNPGHIRQVVGDPLVAIDAGFLTRS